MNDLLKEPVKTYGTVECLGQTFANDEARRERFPRVCHEL